jgi:hypothetical protein
MGQTREKKLKKYNDYFTGKLVKMRRYSYSEEKYGEYFGMIKDIRYHFTWKSDVFFEFPSLSFAR